MAIEASAPVLPNQKKQCCKIFLFTDAPCISLSVGVWWLVGNTKLLKHKKYIKT